MARSSGYKINRHLRSYFMTADPPETLADKAHEIFTIRAICGKYQPLDAIIDDLIEMEAEAVAEQESSETSQTQTVTAGETPEEQEEGV